MRVVVAVEGEVTTRAAHSLASHPGIEVSLLGGDGIARFPRVDDATGHDAVVGVSRAKRVALEAGIPAVVTGELDGSPGVAWASVAGLALALASGLNETERVAVAIPGDHTGDRTVVFPSPIDAQRARREMVGDREVEIAGTNGELAAALALGTQRHRVIVDHHRFMEGIALAAGVLLVEPGVSLAVWERPDAYLQASVEMGLVIGERAA
ncbi:MAG TPA: hypothetical protein VK070_09390 [Acidimicrobiia bacterium]|nr:hypothetical protein [Acidimicrobiia bacterium]